MSGEVNYIRDYEVERTEGDEIRRKSANEIMQMCLDVDRVEGKLMEVLNLAIRLGRNTGRNSIVREENSEVIYYVSNQNILKGLQYEVDNLARNYYARVNDLRKLGINIGMSERLSSNSQPMSDLYSYTEIKLPEFKPFDIGGGKDAM